MTMDEMAAPRSPLQSDSEGSTSSLELGSGVAGIALGHGMDTGTPPPSAAHDAVKCRWQHCGLWLAGLDALALHVTLAHAAAGRGGLFYCGWDGCSRGHRGFNARYKMLVHVRTHTNERPHRCARCEKSFSRAENLKIHARSHTGERPYTCPVPGCNKAYSNSSDRFKHTRTHAVDKPYVCKVEGCPKRYTDPSSLRKHVKTYRHFPSGGGGLGGPDSPQGSERDSSSPLGALSPGLSPQPSSDDEARSAFRPVGLSALALSAPLVSPSALERPPLPGETRGIPIKKAISARVRAVRHHDLLAGGGAASSSSSSARAWAGGSVWVGPGSGSQGSGSTSPDALSLSLSPSSSPSPSPSSGSSAGTAPDWFNMPSLSPSMYSQSPPWAWGPMLSLWGFPQTQVPAQAPAPTPASTPSFKQEAAAPLPVKQEATAESAEVSAQSAPLDLTVTRH